MDAVGWLVLFHVFTSHMTGNTTSLGIELFRGERQQAVRHAWPLVPFLLGLVFSATATAAARRKGLHSSFSIALFTEFILLALFIRLALQHSDAGFFLMAALPAAAMGIQTVTITRVSGLRVYTTYVTGTLSKWAEAMVQYAFWFYDRTRGRFRERFWKIVRVTPRQKYARHAALTGVLWITYLGGALCGAVLQSRYGALALMVSLAILGVAIAVDLVAPVAAADEPGSFDDL